MSALHSTWVEGGGLGTPPVCGDWGARWRLGKPRLSESSEELLNLSREEGMVHFWDRLWDRPVDLSSHVQPVEAVTG